MIEKYLNSLKYEELPSEQTASEARRFKSKDGKEIIEVRGTQITTVIKDSNGAIQVSWKRVGDTD